MKNQAMNHVDIAGVDKLGVPTARRSSPARAARLERQQPCRSGKTPEPACRRGFILNKTKRMKIQITFAAVLLFAIHACFARESWPVAPEEIKQRDAAWSQYEQGVISNVAPQLAGW